MLAAAVIPFTENVTDVVVLGMDAFEIVQTPEDEVLHVAVPLAPLLQTPVTVTLPTEASAALWARIVTLAVHEVDFVVLAPSRSPTWRTLGGWTVTVTVVAGLVNEPSDVRYVKVSVPENPAAGVYVTLAESA
jgi:hypothetical protein